MDYKAPDAFRTISEVAEDLDLPQHVLRFWETRFSQIKPLKRGGGRRYYRPGDVDLLRGIRHMLYGEGYTIKGVQRILKEQGPQGIVDIGRSSAAGRLVPLPQETSAAPGTYEPDSYASGTDLFEDVSGNGDGVPFDDQAAGEGDPVGVSLSELPAEEPLLFQQRLVPPARPPEARSPERMSRDRQATEPFSPQSPTPQADRLTRPVPRQTSAPALRSQPVTDDGELIPAGILPDDKPNRPARFVDRMLGHDTKSGLSRDDVRRLQATLFELLECKRVLDQAR